MVSDHSAGQAGAIRSMSSRNRRDVLIKSVSSAYSTSSGKLASARGRVERRDRRSRKAASRYTVNSTGLRLSPCGVPMDVAKAWQSPVESRGSNEVSASSRRIYRISDSPRNVCSVSRSLSRRIVSNARLRSMPRNSIDTRCRCALALSQRYPKSTSAVLRPRLNPDCEGDR